MNELAFPNGPTIRVIVADDHTILRAGIRSMLERIAGVQVVAEVADGAATLACIAEMRPDLVFMDIAMAGMNGLEATWQLKRDHPQVKVVILSMHANGEYVEQALQLGASGYLLKDARVEEIAEAVRQIQLGEIYLSPAVSGLSLKGAYRTDSEFASLKNLTPRQRDTLKLMADGKTTKEIAKILGIGTKTVETHRAHLMEKLGIHDVAGLVRYALRIGLVEMTP